MADELRSNALWVVLPLALGGTYNGGITNEDTPLFTTLADAQAACEKARREQPDGRADWLVMTLWDAIKTAVDNAGWPNR